VSTTPEELEARYFGKALRLVDVAPDSLGVDVVFADGENGSVLATDAGTPNLAQDLKVALLTPTGSDMFNVAFGFDGLRVLTEATPPLMTQEMLRLSVLKTIALDARIRRVLDVRLAETFPGSRRWKADIEVQTVIGDVLRLVLGEVDGR
jgi:hypothetical protein